MARGTPLVQAPVRVVVVDDNDGYRESLLQLLDHADVTVVGEATGGFESLALVERTEPDIVLMDVHMPSMDGAETTRRLKERRPGVNVVALTGDEDHVVVREMLSAGASGYVLKDADGSDIIAAVRQAARGSAVLSPGVAPGLVDELNQALERERRRSRQLRESHERLTERVAQRHQLVSRLGHELRTPVTVIFGIARTLATGDVPEDERAELLDRLMTRSSALVSLVERFEGAVDEELVEPVDLPALVRLIASPRVSVVASPIPPVPLNPVLARRILEELVDNALRFTPDGSPVEVWVGMAGTRVLVKVMDRGVGIHPTDHEKIFEPLEQCEEVDARIHGGLGIGLSLARAAARAMAGDLFLEASGPGGSTFTWSIPIDAETLAS